MAFRVERTAQADEDFERIADYLIKVHLEFGRSMTEALSLARKRSLAIQRDMESLANAPRQGTLRPEFGDGVRNVTKNRTIFYFVADDSDAMIRVLAIFNGAQDHETLMRKRYP